MKKIVLENNAFQDVSNLSDDATYFTSFTAGSDGFDLSGSFYLTDSQTGVTQLIATGTPYNSGDLSNIHSFSIDTNFLSQDGRFVVYTTDATQQANIFSPTTSTLSINIFDRTTGLSQVVYSDTDDGTGTNQGSIEDVVLSPDGQSVFFSSDFPNLTGNHNPNFLQGGVFELNLQTHAVQTVLAGTINSINQAIDLTLSPGGKYLVAAQSSGTQLLNIATGNVDLILPGEFAPSVSADGRFAVFDTDQALVPQDTNGVLDVYLADLTTGAITLVSQTAAGAVGNDISDAFGTPQISADGSEVLFETTASNISPGASAGTPHLMIWERGTGYLNYITTTDNNLVAADSYRLSADGQTIAISTLLTPAGTNAANDIYLIHISRPLLTIDAVNGDGYLNAADNLFVTLSGTSDAYGQTIEVTAAGKHVSAVVQANGTWSTSIFTAGLADGPYDVHALVSDGLTATTDRNFTVDRTPPQLTFTSVAGDDIVNLAESPHAVVAGALLSADPAGPGTLPGAITISIDDDPRQPLLTTSGSSSPGAQDFSKAIDISGLADGEHKITLTATDEAGNTASVSKEVLVDKTPPKISITTVSGDDVVSSNEIKTEQGVHGTSDAIGQTVDVLIDGVEGGQAVVQADGTWLTTVSFAGTATGVHDVSAEVSDEAGNPGRADAGVYVDTGFAVTQLSAGPTGAQGGGQGVLFPGLSADGTKLVFTGLNFDLMSLATGSDGAQVYIKDLTSGAISFATPDPGQNAEFGAISPDGRYVEFVTNAGLDPINQSFGDDTPGLYFTYTKDLTTGTVYVHHQVDDRFDGTDPDTLHPGITDGYFNPFGDPVGTPIKPLPVFPLAVANGGSALELVSLLDAVQVVQPVVMTTYIREDSNDPSVNADGTPFYTSTPTGVLGPDAAPPIENNFGSFIQQEYAPQISADGSVVAYEALFFPEQVDTSVFPATDTVGAPTLPQIYAGPASDPAQALASSFADGTPMPFGAIDPALSADGKFVAFWSWDNGDKPQVYVKNLTTGELKIASSDASGIPGVSNASGAFNAGFNSIAISADGRYVAFTSDALLTPGDTGTGADLFVKDTQTGAIQRVPLPAGTFANDLSAQLTMTANGQYIAFTTSAGLAAMDSNHVADVYGISLAALGTPPQITINPVADDDRINKAEDTKHVTVSGTSDAIGQAVTLYVDGGFLPGVVVAADGTWSTTIDATGLIDGVHQLRVTVSNANGATGSDGDLVTVDTIAPTVVLSSDKTHLSAGQTATITATFSEGIGNLGDNFFTAMGGTLGQIQFTNDHTLTALFTPDAGATGFSITANPGTAYDFAGNANTEGTGLSIATDLSIGGNTAPVLSAVSTPSPVAEAANASAQVITANGTLTVLDADLGDTLTAAVAGPATIAFDGAALPAQFAAQVAALTASGALTFGGPITATGGAQTITWTYAPVATNLEFLSDTDTLTITTPVKVDDGTAGSVIQNVVVTITGVNDAPTVTGPDAVSGVTGVAIALAGLSVFDPEVLAGSQTLRVDVQGDTGTFAVGPGSGATVTAHDRDNGITIDGTLDQINAALASLTVTTQVDSSFNVTVQARDSLGALSATQHIAVTTTDTAPTVTATGPDTVSGATGVAIALAGLSVFDPEVLAGSQTLRVDVQGDTGTFAVGPGSGATVTAHDRDNGITIDGTLDQINAALASLTVTTQVDSSFNVTVQARDSLGALSATQHIAVTTTDTAPTVTATGPDTVSGATGVAIALAGLSVFDPEVLAGSQTLRVDVQGDTGTFAVGPGSGATVTPDLRDNGITIDGTLDQINAALASLTVTTQVDSSFNVTVQARDSLGALSATQHIAVTTTDTAPTVTGPDAVSGVTGTAVALAGLSVFDPEVLAGSQTLRVDVQGDTGTFAVGPGSGATVTAHDRDNGITIDGTLDQINAALASLTVTTQVDSSFNVTVQARDSLGALSPTQHIAVTTTADTAPTVTGPDAVSGVTGTAVAIAGLSVFDPEVLAGSQTLRVDVQGDTGTFAVGPGSGATVTAHDRDNGITIDGTLDQINAALASLTVTTQVDSSFNVTVQARDSLGALSPTQHIAVTTTADTAPTVTGPDAVSGVTGTAVAIAGLSVFDPEVLAGSQTLRVDVQGDTGTFAVGPGSGATVTAHDRDNGITIDGTLDQINAALASLTVTTQVDSSFNVTVQARDSLGALSPTQHIAVTTTADTAPTVTGPDAVSGVTGTAVAIAGLSVFDPEVLAGSQTLRVDVQGDTGTFAVGPGSGATVTAHDRDNGITIDGTLDQINAALASLTVTTQVDSSFNVTVQARDSLGALSATQHIAVTTTDTAPTVTATGPDTVSGATGVAIALAGLSVFDPEVLAGSQTLRVDVQGDTGTFAVGPGSGATVTAHDRDNGITIDGTLDQINAALASLTVTTQVDSSFNVTVQARDSLGALSATQHIAVTTTDTAPTVTATGPDTVSGATGVAIALAGLSVFDPEVLAGSQTLRVDVQGDTGTFAVGPGSGATVTPDLRDNGITIDGTLDQINAALAGLTVTSQSVGTFDVDVLARDSLNVSSPTQHIAVTVAPSALVIPDGGTFTVAAGQTLQALSLNVGTNATLHIDGTVIIQNGDVSGTVSNSGTIEVALNASFSDDLHNLAGALFTNSGTTADTVAANGGTITNTGTGVWNGDVPAGANGNGGDIINQGVWNGTVNNDGGTIENAGSWNGAIIDTAGTFTNTGSINGSIIIGSTGALALEGTGSISNSSPVQDAGTLDISGVSAAITHIVDLAGSGIVTLGSNVLSIDDEVSKFTGTFTSGTGSGLLVSGANIDLSGAHFTSWSSGQTVSLTGTGNAATLIGSVVDDHIAIQAGDGIHDLTHTIDGGSGTNTLKLSGKLSDYSLSNTVDAEHFTITDSVVGRDGIDILSNIQFIQFAGDGDKLVATDSIAHGAATPTLALAADSGVAGDGITKIGTVNVTGLETGATWQYAVNGGAFVTGTGTSFTLTGDGPKAVLVYQTDAAGNVSADASLNFTLDTAAAAPSVALATDSGASGTDHITNSGVVNVSGLETGATWQYSIDNGAHWLAGTGSSFTLTGDGGKSVLVHQVDPAGNISAASALAFTLDTVTSDTISTASATVTDPTQTIQGTGEIGASIQLHDGSSNLGGPVTVDASGHWAETVALTGAGDHIITALATDLAGNSAQSNAIKLSLNSTNVIDQPGEWIVNGTPNADQIIVHANNLLVAAGGGDDVITIAPDAVRGFFHLLEGGAGNDTLDLSRITADVSVDLGSGLGGDTLAFWQVSLNGIENVTGGSGNDTLIGNNASNALNGGAGADTIRGGNGNDTVIGGGGNDILSGGSGDDVFVFRPGFGHDRIISPAGSADFQVGTAAHHDTLDLRGLGFASMQDVFNHTDPGANAVIHAGADDITLIGVTKAQLQMHSFDLTI